MKNKTSKQYNKVNPAALQQHQLSRVFGSSSTNES